MGYRRKSCRLSTKSKESRILQGTVSDTYLRDQIFSCSTLLDNHIQLLKIHFKAKPAFFSLNFVLDKDFFLILQCYESNGYLNLNSLEKNRISGVSV